MRNSHMWMRFLYIWCEEVSSFWDSLAWFNVVRGQVCSKLSPSAESEVEKLSGRKSRGQSCNCYHRTGAQRRKQWTLASLVTGKQRSGQPWVIVIPITSWMSIRSDDFKAHTVESLVLPFPHDTLQPCYPRMSPESIDTFSLYNLRTHVTYVH